MKVLKRLMGGERREMPAEVARFFIELSFPQTDQKRIKQLSEKANEGELLPEEREELEMYVLLTDFLAALQSSARHSMQKKSPAA